MFKQISLLKVLLHFTAVGCLVIPTFSSTAEAQMSCSSIFETAQDIANEQFTPESIQQFIGHFKKTPRSKRLSSQIPSNSMPQAEFFFGEFKQQAKELEQRYEAYIETPEYKQQAKIFNDIISYYEPLIAQKKVTYLEYINLSTVLAFSYDFTLLEETYPNSSYSQKMEEMFYKIKQQQPATLYISDIINRDKFIFPLMRDLSIRDFNNYSDTNIRFVGITQKSVKADGKLFKPLDFFLHDLVHSNGTGVVVDGIKVQKLVKGINSISDDFTRRTANIIWFNYWHEANREKIDIKDFQNDLNDVLSNKMGAKITLYQKIFQGFFGSSNFFQQNLTYQKFDDIVRTVIGLTQ